MLDEIHLKILKELTEELAKTLSIICHQSWLTREFPDVWRLTSVMPTYKEGLKEDPGHYRPISLTLVSGKLLEHILSVITPHMKDNQESRSS